MSTETWAQLSTDAFSVAFFAYLFGMLAAFHFLAFRKRPVWVASVAAAGLGLGADVVSIVARGAAAGRIPLGNMYEYSVLLSFLVVLAYLVFIEGLAKVRTVGGFVLGFVVVTMAVAVLFLYVGPEPLIPALNSYWRQVHVSSMIVSSSLLALGGVLTTLYLVKERRERRSGPVVPIMGGSVDLEAAPPHLEAGADEPAASTAPARRGFLPSAATLDRLAYRMIAFGFPIWTFGIITGAIWAESAWGRYWGWDPKETWSFVTWVVFAGYLHARATSGWKGRRAAVIALVGFASLLVTYYAVNLWIVGLHSYAK
ncbi:MAG: c-type cytochrome biogenesis protein CcsB [Solirubrobacterales bacterium]